MEDFCSYFQFLNDLKLRFSITINLIFLDYCKRLLIFTIFQNASNKFFDLRIKTGESLRFWGGA